MIAGKKDHQLSQGRPQNWAACVSATPLKVRPDRSVRGTGGRQELFRIPLTFDGDRGGDPFDLGEIICRQLHVCSLEIFL
jgi:hypothetical protein